MSRARLLFALGLVLLAPAWPVRARADRVTFDASGITHVGCRPFFPVGLFVYAPDPPVLSDLGAMHFNTVTCLTPDFAHIGKFMDEARRIHGPDWPHWTYIQVFGGPETEGGKWAQPRPNEVRCMAYLALARRADGLFYFADWPKAPETWRSLGRLNAEIQRLSPWLVASGTERPARSSDPQVQVRARRVGTGGFLLAVNAGTTPAAVALTVPGLTAPRLHDLFQPRRGPVSAGTVRDTLGPHETRVYVWGPSPKVAMTGRR